MTTNKKKPTKEKNVKVTCIYDETKEDVRLVLLDTFKHFVQRELENV